jgi:c(7)-type cytochrome triheme protein
MTRLVSMITILLGCAALGAAQISRVGGGDIVFELQDVPPARFSHDVHVARAALKCQGCHPKPWTNRARHRPVTMEQMQTKRESCGACHDGTRTFSVADACEKCHLEP